MKKFLKDTRGVVMLEYIILGLFAVAVTIAAVHVLGQAYSNGLLAMAKATVGNTSAVVVTVETSAAQINSASAEALLYGEELTTAGEAATGSVYDWDIYPAGTVTP